MASKARVYFQHALKVKPNFLCAKYCLVSPQTATTDKDVRDVAAGTNQLESLWTRTGKRTWRMSFALAQAYDAAARTEDASSQWEETLKLAPLSKHEELLALRNKETLSK